MPKYTYDYPMPSVTVDAVILCDNHILLIRRKEAPFKDRWALPGGYMDINETLSNAVRREVKEETNLDISKKPLYALGAFDAPERDPRGRVISFAFLVRMDYFEIGGTKAGDDAAEYQWANLKQPLPPLAFDHEQIIKKAMGQGTK